MGVQGGPRPPVGHRIIVAVIALAVIWLLGVTALNNTIDIIKAVQEKQSLKEQGRGK